MPRLVGVDIAAGTVRAVLLHTSYRSLELERLLEVDVGAAGSLDAALQACVLPLAQHGEPVAVAVSGEQTFLHRIKLPATALKQLEEVLPYELEAQMPVDISELVFDHRLLRRAAATDPVIVLTAAARQDAVRSRINVLRGAVAREPERIGAGPLPLANLSKVSTELAVAEPVAIVDMGSRHTEVVVLREGEAIFARTLSRGVEGLPATANALSGELRQTFAAAAAHTGTSVTAVYLVGGGATTEGAEAYLAHQLGIPVAPLPPLRLTGVPPEQLVTVPRFAKAIALALSLSPRPRDLDLRQGPLAFQRGYGFLKEKIPVLTGLGAAIFISILFSTWAELRALDRENEALVTALGSLSKEVLGKETSDPAEAVELLERAKSGGTEDPMPHMDAFGVLVQLSTIVPQSMTHDIEEFDMQRGHVKINGVVSSTADAQLIAAELGKHRCIKDAKVVKVSQVVNSERQKYVLEFDVKCPEDQGAKKKKKKEGGAAPETTAGGE